MPFVFAADKLLATEVPWRKAAQFGQAAVLAKMQGSCVGCWHGVTNGGGQ